MITTPSSIIPLHKVVVNENIMLFVVPVCKYHKLWYNHTNNMKGGITMFIGERLKNLRNERSISQPELGKIIGVSQQSISCYENYTRDPDTETLKKIAQYFDVSTDYLLGKTDVRNPEKELQTEKELVKKFRMLSSGNKENLLNYLDYLISINFYESSKKETLSTSEKNSRNVV